MKREPLLKFEDMAEQDDYCRLARNICQKIYKNRSSGRIDFKTGKQLIAEIRKQARHYFNGDISPAQFLTVVAEAEKLRSEITNSDLTSNHQYRQLINLIAYEQGFVNVPHGTLK